MQTGDEAYAAACYAAKVRRVALMSCGPLPPVARSDLRR